MCAYVEDTSAFETDSMIARTIEKKAEAFYRNMNQRTAALPSSSNEVKNKVLKAKSMNLTPQESEQLSEYVSNDTYVKKQKEDIEELALMFKGMLGESENESKYIKMFKESFAVGSDVSACYQIRLTDNKEDILIKVEGNIFECTNELAEKVDILIKTKASVLDHIIEGNQTFQSAFMSGDLTAKGNFNILRTLDTLFIFQ